MKRILLASLLFLFVFILIPGQAKADLLPLVQCGGPGQHDCGICDLFEMINRIFQFIITRIIPPVAVIMLLIGGIMFFFAGGSPNMLSAAKKILLSTVIGLLVIFAAFMIIGAILNAIGLADWTAQLYKNMWSDGFFHIPCN